MSTWTDNQNDYRASRAAENRARCLSCGTTDAVCTDWVLAGKKACCSTCGYTDTHPQQADVELTATDVAEMIDNNQLTAARRVLTRGTQQSSSVLALDVALALLDRNGGYPLVQIERVRRCLRRGLG